MDKIIEHFFSFVTLDHVGLYEKMYYLSAYYTKVIIMVTAFTRKNIMIFTLICFFGAFSLAAKVKTKAKIRQIASSLAEGVGIDCTKEKNGKKKLVLYYHRPHGLFSATRHYGSQLIVQGAIAGVLLNHMGFFSNDNFLSHVKDRTQQRLHDAQGISSSSLASPSLSSSSSSSSSLQLRTRPTEQSFWDHVSTAAVAVTEECGAQNRDYLLTLGATALSTVSVIATLYGLLKMAGQWRRCEWVMLDAFGIKDCATGNFLRWDHLASITVSNNGKTLTLVGKEQDLVFDRLDMPLSIESFLGCLEVFVKQHVDKAIAY